jgi:hypothetical protein
VQIGHGAHRSNAACEGWPGEGKPHAHSEGRVWKSSQPWLTTTAALGKPRDLSPASPMAGPAPYSSNLPV